MGSRRSLALFFLLTLFAWAIWIPQAARSYGVGVWAPSMQSPLNALTVWSPGLAAMLLCWRASGKAGIATLFSRLGLWRVPLKWYLVALFLAPALWFCAFGIDRLTGQTYNLETPLLLQSFSAGAVAMIPIAAVFTLPNALGEELGWRAFALPRLQQKHSPIVASIVIGIFWGFWHVPAWLAWSGVEASPLPILVMVVNMVPAAIVFTWLFNRTNGSLLLVTLYHASIANKGYFLPTLPTYAEPALLWLVAVAIVTAGGMTRRRSSDTGFERATDEEERGG
jgi:membrane protease YdiL (CAAX protease family)